MPITGGKRREIKPVLFDDAYIISINIGNWATFSDPLVGGTWTTVLGPYAGCNSSTSVAIGMFSTIGQGMSNCTVVGQFSQIIGTSGYGNLILGAGNTIFENGGNTTICGCYSTVAPGNTGSFVAGYQNHTGEPSPGNSASGNVVVGAWLNIGLAADIAAHATLAIPGPADYVNYDNVIFPDGSGGTITVMFQTDGSYVDPGGVYTVDVQGMTTAQDVWNAIWAILQANTTLGDGGGGGDPIWTQTLTWPVGGTVGNGQPIVNNVASPNFQATNFDGGFNHGCGRDSVFIGCPGNVEPEFQSIVSIGCNHTIHGLQTDSLVIGSNNYLGNGALYTTQPIGGYGNILVGARSTVFDGAVMATAIGFYATASGSCSIALGPFASAGANEFIVGISDISSLDRSIHRFAVRGYNNGALDTLTAIDNPTDGYTGLTVVYNASGTYSNKAVQAAVSPPPGSLILFVAPSP
jgi:hypothetical protein